MMDDFKSVVERGRTLTIVANFYADFLVAVQINELFRKVLGGFYGARCRM